MIAPMWMFFLAAFAAMDRGVPAALASRARGSLSQLNVGQAIHVQICT